VTPATRKLSLLFIAVCTLLLGGLLPASAATGEPAKLAGTVTWVYDADTLEITPHGKVRLLGIDAPEKNASSRDDKFTALGAPHPQLRVIHDLGLDWCIEKVKNRPVTLTFDKTRRDRHGRLLAYVHLNDGRLLNRLLLEEGLVIVYRRFPFRLKADFLAAESKARQEGVGLWRKPSPSAPKAKNE
jgi:micrococcal nuclease